MYLNQTGFWEREEEATLKKKKLLEIKADTHRTKKLHSYVSPCIDFNLVKE